MALENDVLKLSLALVMTGATLQVACSKDGLTLLPDGGKDALSGSGGSAPGAGGAAGSGGVGSGGAPGVGGAAGSGGNGSGGMPGSGGTPSATGGMAGGPSIPDAGPMPSDGPVDRPIPADAWDAPKDRYPEYDSLQVCVSNGRVYKAGEVFDVDCNTCMCLGYGFKCTTRTCNDDGGPSPTPGPDGGVCPTLLATLIFWSEGGQAPHVDRYRLTSTSFIVMREYPEWSFLDGARGTTCSLPLPSCGTRGVTSIDTINASLADPEVQAVWTLPQTPVPFFGTDPREADGTVFGIALDEGHQVLIGDQCASPDMSSCRHIPEGLVRLKQDLQALATAMTADPACARL